MTFKLIAREISSSSETAKAFERKCECGCCHRPDYGACPTYEPGDQQGVLPTDHHRCVYCDHAEACHERDKGNKYYNLPLTVGKR